jgi:plasmid stabilization system protein ParE
VETDLFKVEWTKRARKKYAKIINQISKDAPIRAVDFGRRLQDATASLRWSPHRCPRTRENPTRRHLIYKKYRIIFRIDENKRTVWIHTIRFPYERYG